MAKVIKDAALVIGAAVAIATAIPSGGTSLLAYTLGTAGATAAAVGALALTALATITAKKPSLPSPNPMQWQSDPQAGLPIVAGRAYTGGKIVYRNAYQKNNEAETIITVYSIGPVKGVEGLYVDSVLTTQNGITVNINDRGHMYASTQLGAQPEPKQLGDLGPPNYTTASKLSGLCASSVTFTYDTSGGHTLTTEPQVGYVIQGVRVYDPRKDSTYPGGNGPQRWNDETTWTYVGYDNPYLFALAWLIGWHQNGKLVAGVGVSTSAILMDQYVEGANVADANGWKMGGVLDSTDDKWSRLKDILQAGGGVPMRLGAQIGCMINTPKTSLATVTVDDVIGDASVQATQAQRDRINAIVPRYMAELDNTVADPSQPADSNGNHPLITNVTWAMVAASPVVVSDYVTFDGKQRQKQVDYTFVQNLTQSQQLARYDIENSREFGPITLPLKLRWMGYKPGDVVTCNLPELGLNGQNILLLQRELSPQDMTVTMTARSETYAKHAFALGQTGTAPATPSVSGPALIPTPGNAAWEVTGGTIASDNGTAQPVIEVIGAVDSSVIDAVVFQYRSSQSDSAQAGPWIDAGSQPPTIEQLNIFGLKDGGIYDVSVAYRKGSGTGTPLILGPATCGQTAIPYQTGVVGPKPPVDADNTASAFAGASGGLTIQQVIVSIDSLTTQTTDLVAIYGDTASAAASAQASEQAEQAAALSATNAEDYSQSALTSSTASNGYAAVASSAAAAAAQSATLSASVGPGVLNPNPNFASWTNPATAPDSWQIWNSAGGNPTQVAGLDGQPYSVHFDAVSGQDCGIAEVVSIAAGKYVVEVTADLTAGTYDGSGVLVQWNHVDGSGATNIGGQILSFLTATDTAGYVGNNGFRRTWSMYVDTGVNGSINSFSIYAMANWEGFSAALSGKGITFRTLRIRPAGADALTAMAQISTETNVRASADTALSSRIDTITATVGGNSADISTLQTAVANNYASAAQQISSLTATTGTLTSNVTTLTAATSDVKDRVGSAVFQIAAQSGTSRALFRVSADGYAASEIDAVAASYRLFAQDSDDPDDAIEALGIDSSGLVTIPNLAAQQIRASHIINDQGVDLATIVPGSLNYKVSGSQTVNVALSAGQTSDTFADSALVTAGNQELAVSCTMVMHSTGTAGDENTFNGFIHLMTNSNGAGWVSSGIIGSFGMVPGQSSTLGFSSVLTPTIAAGSLQYALAVECSSGGDPGVVTSGFYSIKAAFYK